MGMELDRSALETAPPDVRQMVEQLVDDQSAEVLRFASPPGTTNGNVLVDLRRDDVVIRITRDRGQWMLDVQVDGQRMWPLDLVCDAINERQEWSQWTGPLPKQLPPGVSWPEWLPRAVHWLRSTPDAAARLGQVGNARAKQIFP